MQVTANAHRPPSGGLAGRFLGALTLPRPVWARSRLDIGWADLAAAAVASSNPGGPSAEAIAQRWDPDGAVFLTVRTAWDALLAELATRPGPDPEAGCPGEVVVTAVNIPDMFELLAHHGFVPVPVDIEPGTLAPAPGAIAAAVNERTRLCLVTHLLGSRVDMDAVFAELDSAGSSVPVVEDCAQAFEGLEHRGHPRSLAALFSFGPIKSSSALGGCLARIADAELRQAALARTRAYPQQSRRGYLGVVTKYAALKAMTEPHLYAAFVGACALTGRSHDAVINGAVLGLEGDEYWAALRRQPSGALLATLERRLEGYDGVRLSRRRAHGEVLRARLRGRVALLGDQAPWRSWWQVAVVSSNPEGLIDALRAEGFDATRGSSRLRPPQLEGGASTPLAEAAMASLVYVPAYPELPASELERLAQLILETESR
ncbi:aminotransferase, DegT/DnrJ/EryC1/StrS family protein [Plesiocystis pacifica SIR-1]|uniref:Aminotransferase, DegT/DnrJ/EryC1/StrS family protein n=1 Tax=Plesiocystis pacifica SIR-1 TaxID=391625 RepID=A6GCY9_9BACT|nr:DegT/DnrJ/EryC1/StrS family aminotransferase [Plesiocystis pacifica]EDM76227.1 aminotransferase, DegT/DnrJ/EryC1/StrS family protein [Plesiocystis pacifica SIR-1]